MNNFPFYLQILLTNVTLLLQSQSMNDSEGDNCKLRRRKLSFDSEGEKGNSFYLQSLNVEHMVISSSYLNVHYTSDLKGKLYSGFKKANLLLFLVASDVASD